MAVLKLADQVDLLATVSLASKQAEHNLTLHSTDSLNRCIFNSAACLCVVVTSLGVLSNTTEKRNNFSPANSA